MRQFYGRLEKCVLSAGKKPMSIKFLVLGGGGVFWVFLGGGGECRFYFYGRADFSEQRVEHWAAPQRNHPNRQSILFLARTMFSEGGVSMP